MFFFISILENMLRKPLRKILDTEYTKTDPKNRKQKNKNMKIWFEAYYHICVKCKLPRLSGISSIVNYLFLKWSLKLIICSLLIGFSMILSAPDN